MIKGRESKEEQIMEDSYRILCFKRLVPHHRCLHSLRLHHLMGSYLQALLGPHLRKPAVKFNLAWVLT